MTVVALDTNVVLDYLLDRPEIVRTEQLFRLIADGDVSVYLPLPVVLECEWVLRTTYRKTKPDILIGLAIALDLADVSDVPLPVIQRAIAAYRNERAVNFTDCMIVALVSAASIGTFVTGDRKLAKLYKKLKGRPS